MNSKRNLIAAMTMMAVAYADFEGATRGEKRPIEKKTLSEKKKVIRNKGLKPYDYGENTVWAINKKNADRKARKLGYKNK